MEKSDMYPKSGVYREHRKEIEKMVSATIEDRFEQKASLFIPHIESANPEEKQDVLNFARYAAKRILNGHINSPMNREYLAEDPKELIAGLAPYTWHDLTHSMFRYQWSSGESLIPKFMGAEDTGTSYADQDAFSEECSVVAWESFEDFIKRQAQSGIKPEEGSDPVEFYAKQFEDVFFDQQAKALRELEVDEEAIDQMELSLLHFQKTRDLRYTKLMTALYENSVSANPNPRIYIEQFELILKPLLERLRSRDETHPVTQEPDPSFDSDPQQDDAGQQKEIEKQKTLVRDVLKRLYHSRAESIEPKVQMVDPRTLDYKEHSEQALDWQNATAEEGSLILNPEMAGRDLADLEVFVELPQFNPEEAIFDVMQYIVDTYGKTHLIPGLEYWEWLLENPDKVPEKLKTEDQRYTYYFPGSLYANSSKKWEVPAYNKGRSYSISSRGVGARWSSSSRVLLLANPEVCAKSVKTALADLDAKFGAEDVSRVLYENFNGGIKDNTQPLVQEYWKVMKELQGKLGLITVLNARKAECEVRNRIES